MVRFVDVAFVGCVALAGCYATSPDNAAPRYVPPRARPVTTSRTTTSRTTTSRTSTSRASTTSTTITSATSITSTTSSTSSTISSTSSTAPTPSATDSCPLNKGFVPFDRLPDADVCAANLQNAYYRDLLAGQPDTCPVPIGANGERLYHWLPKGKSIDQRRAQPPHLGLHPDHWQPWTHRPVCADKGKYCVFSAAGIPGLPLGSTPEIVVRESTPSLTDAVRSKISSYFDVPAVPALPDNDTTDATLLTPGKNKLYNSKWDALPGQFTAKEAVFQGLSILTTPEMAASALHPHSFALHPQALEQYERFAALAPAYKIQRIPDLPDVKLQLAPDEMAVVDDQDDDQDDRVHDADDDDDDDGAEGDDFGDIVIEDDEEEDEEEDNGSAAAAAETRAAEKELPPDIQALLRNGSRLMQPDAPRKKTPVELTSSKGWGAVAARDIRAGEPVLMERPAIIAHDTLYMAGDDDMAVHGSHLTVDEDDHGLSLESVAGRARLWKAMVDQLPPATAARVRSLHVLPKYRADFEPRPAALDALNQTSSAFYDADYRYRNAASQLSLEEKVFDSNAFAMTIDGYPLKGLFPNTAIINHACQPNTVASWSELPMAMTVYASRDIKKGEELTLNYLNDDLTLKARTLLSAHRFGFKCQCHLCRAQRADPAARRRSDDRRDLLKYELPSIAQSALSLGRLDLALQAYLLARDTMTAEGLRRPGTVRESDIGLFRGAAIHSRAPVADAFGPAGLSMALGELLAQQDRLADALPYLRAALVENAWRSAGWETRAQRSASAALHVLVQAVEAELTRRDLARGGDGVAIHATAATAATDSAAPSLTVAQLSDMLNRIADEMEEKEFLRSRGRDVDE